jgi:hypothetical protein
MTYKEITKKNAPILKDQKNEKKNKEDIKYIDESIIKVIDDNFDILLNTHKQVSDNYKDKGYNLKLEDLISKLKDNIKLVEPVKENNDEFNDIEENEFNDLEI